MPARHSSFTDKAALCLSRLGVAGLSPYAPGTAGSALAALIAPFVFLPLPLWARLVLLALIFYIGSLAAGRAELLLGEKDPGQVVIDELMGLWIVLCPFAVAPWWLVGLAFVLFRLFDITKPWPVKASETWLPGGYGVMIDDAVAGLQALAVLWLAGLLGLVPLAGLWLGAVAQ